MDKKYISEILSRSPLPRSKRLRERGVGGTASGSTVVVNGGVSGSAVSVETHSHANKAALDQISTDGEGYEHLTRNVEVENPDTGETEVKTITEKVKAGYADKAYDLAEDSPAAKRFLSRIANDMAEGHITFAQGLAALSTALLRTGVHIGEFTSGLYSGTGAAIDSGGNAEVESLRVRSYMEVMELIVNRLSAIEGDQLLTEGDTIERVEDLGDGTYGLYLRQKWEGYFTAQAPGNVVKGIFNTLAAGSGDYYTSWMRVNSVNPALNYIEVTMYPDAETPAGKNFPPVEMMNIARWGNQTDESRQSCIYLSSTEGRIVKLTGVTKPIIGEDNYGMALGSLPEWLYDMGLPLVKGRDYGYFQGVVIQDLITLDRRGKPKVTYVDRGAWDASADYYNEAVNPDTGVFETSDVWYMGCKYRCMRTGTRTPPAWNSTEWAMLEGNPDFTVEFAGTDYLLDPDRIDLTLTIVARLHNMDVTADILDTDVVWTRYSEDAEGSPRTASDTAWAIKRAGAGKSLRLTAEDMDFNGYVPSLIRFTATVTLRDGSGEAATQARAIFEY